jgi:hypothetical protein
MNGAWPRAREVEKPKNVTERRLCLKRKAITRADHLRLLADAVLATFGMHSPLVSELRDTADLVVSLASELRVPTLPTDPA